MYPRKDNLQIGAKKTAVRRGCRALPAWLTWSRGMTGMGRTMRISPVNGALGAEITGVNLAQMDDATAEAVRQAFFDHLVLAFPDQDLAPGAQVAFTELFGPVNPHPLRTRDSVEGFPAVLILENRPGRPGAPNDYWHSDISHAKQPPSASVLHAKTIPAGRGDTMFCNMYAAWEALSPVMQGMLAPLNALHSGMATYQRSLGRNDARRIDPGEVKPPCAHPIMRTHPKTGRKALFVNPHFTTGIEGMTEDESKPLLNVLYEVATKPENVYRHRWREGDVLMWDNRVTMHYAVLDYTEDMPRKLHRTTAGGEVPA
jgi:taurine dioxygenase